VSGRDELHLSGAVRRALERELPVTIALAVWEFCDGPLRENPRRVGRPLGRKLTGYFSARRGAYRVVYRLIENEPVIHVVRIEHPSRRASAPLIPKDQEAGEVGHDVPASSAKLERSNEGRNRGHSHLG